MGTPAVTTRGMVETDMADIADMIADVVDQGEAAVESGARPGPWRCAPGYPLYE